MIEAVNLEKTFPGPPPHRVLKGINLKVEKGETVAVMGRSGEGKSTLLHLLGTLDVPTGGSLKVCGETVSGTQSSHLRNRQIGFVFQFYNLLEDFSALDNVLMPAYIARSCDDAMRARANDLLSEVGLDHKAQTKAQYLSGGEKQRIAIARALLHHPSLILADEPTGNLDRKHSVEIQKLLLQSAVDRKTTLILVTHDEEFARCCSRLLSLKEGGLYTLD